MIRQILGTLSSAAIRALRPVKIYAYQTRFDTVKGLILEATSFVDFSMILLNIQNNAMLLHQEAYGGNFLFGKAVAVTDHETAAAAIAAPLFKCNHFMGVDIVSTDSAVFASNSGSLNQCPALRKVAREAMDKTIFTPRLRAKTYASIAKECKTILDDWAKNRDMSNMLVLRSAATRMFLQVLDGKTVSAEDAEAATKNYFTHFGLLSAFGRYLPAIPGILRSRENLRRGSYFMLRDKYDMNIDAIDMTLFAAQFSVGTLVIQCVTDLQKTGLAYEDLDYDHKRNFIIEAVRLWPTVTSVHRIVESDETIRVGDHDLKLRAGDEVIYPFVCTNRDGGVFRNPMKIDLDRPQAEYDAVLSWSKGSHGCPGKALSIDVTMLMLDKLAERYDLSKLKIYNPTF